MSRTDTMQPPTGAADQQGDRLLEEAFSCYQHELLGTLYYLVGNSEDARDALQEAFIKCWRRRESIGEVKNLKAWIFRVVLNVGRDTRSTAWRRRRRPLVDAELLPSSQGVSPEADLDRREQLGRIRRALMELRREEQEVFLLRQNAEMTYEEIAEAIDVPTGTVKTRMRLALGKLREAIGT